jgi:hypothetical protein
MDNPNDIEKSPNSDERIWAFWWVTFYMGNSFPNSQLINKV